MGRSDWGGRSGLDEWQRKDRRGESLAFPFSGGACSACLLVLSVLLIAGCQKRGTPSSSGAPAPVTTPSGAVMLLLPGGWFEVGSDPAVEKDEKRHRVYVDAFYIDRFEVTQANYQKLVGANPSRYKDPNCPVDQVRWTQAAAYCNARSRAEGLAACYDPNTWACDFDAGGYRLPTEAEWEYACRAGSQAAWCFGDDEPRLAKHGWYKANQTRGPHAVGRLAPNAWGLYDVHGNLWEWCNDWYAEDAYAQGPARNPRGPAAGKDRVLRGGCWDSRPNECRSAYRYYEKPVFTDVCFGKAVSGFVGIRCVRKR